MTNGNINMKNSCTIKLNQDCEVTYGISCMICGESIPVGSISELQCRGKEICEKCKKAILKIREQMEQEEQ